MTLEEKLYRLRVTSMEEARINANDIITKHKNSVDQVFADHKEVALRQAELSIKTEKNNVKQQLNKSIATYQTDLKRKQGRLQKQLKKQLFNQVKDELHMYMETSEYTDLLVSYINSAKEFAGTASITIYINPTDTEKLPLLEDRTNTILAISKEDFIGGIRSVIHDRNILIDRSFRSALAEQYENFHFTGGDLND